MSRIFEFTFPYRLVRKYMLFAYDQFYDEIIVRGRENLPSDDSAIIFAPNHLNALMDALAVSYVMPPRKAVIYLARADFFTKKTIADVLHFAKILPVFRMRDGFDKLDKNNKTFYECIDVLRFGHAVCIMPEGGQGEEHRVRPLSKGIFRIALDAQLEFGTERKVKIIPFGIDMEDLIACGKHLIINIGKPIDVQDYITDYQTNPPTVVNEMKRVFHQRLSDLTLDLATSENYVPFETISEIMGYEYSEPAPKENRTFEQFKLKQKAAKTLVEIEKSSPEMMNELKQLGTDYNTKIKKLHFQSNVFSQLKSEDTSFLRFLSLLLTLPFFVFGFLTNILPSLLTIKIRKALKIEYSGFFSSVHLGVGMLLFPLFYALQGVLFHLLLSPNWFITLSFMLMEFFSFKFSLKWHTNLVQYLQKVKFNSLLVAEVEQSSMLYKLIELRNKIVYRMNTKNKGNL
ncbi:MAG: 1-acyl-sn-glycerol-3-phosphate acyltransferase [Paludibacteraceae bacterium]